MMGDPLTPSTPLEAYVPCWCGHPSEAHDTTPPYDCRACREQHGHVTTSGPPRAPVMPPGYPAALAALGAHEERRDDEIQRLRARLQELDALPVAPEPVARDGVRVTAGGHAWLDVPGGEAKEHARAKQPVIAYACLYHRLARVARAHGYALAMHGSLLADLDLVAVPWVHDAASGEDLAAALAVAAPGFVLLDTWTGRPGGVRKHVIHLGGGPYLDLCVTPRASAAPAAGDNDDDAHVSHPEAHSRCLVLGDPADARTRCILVRTHTGEHACPDWPTRLAELAPVAPTTRLDV